MRPHCKELLCELMWNVKCKPCKPLDRSSRVCSSGTNTSPLDPTDHSVSHMEIHIQRTGRVSHNLTDTQINVRVKSNKQHNHWNTNHLFCLHKTCYYHKHIHENLWGIMQISLLSVHVVHCILYARSSCSVCGVKR